VTDIIPAVPDDPSALSGAVAKTEKAL
jgi:hypothetical protein